MQVGFGMLLACSGAVAQPIDQQQATILRRKPEQVSQQASAEPHAPPSLFRVLGDGVARLSLQQQTQLAAIRQERSSAAVRLVEVDFDALRSPVVRLDLFGRAFRAWSLHTESVDRSGKTYAWRAALTCAEDFVSLHVDGDRVHGTLRTKGTHVEFEPLGARIHAVIDVKPLLSKEHPPQFPTGAESEPHRMVDRSFNPKLKDRPLFTRGERQRPVPPELFSTKRVRAAQLSAAMKTRLASIQARESTWRVDLLEFNLRALAPEREALTLNLPRDRRFIAYRTEILGPHEPGQPYTWLGALALAPANVVHCVVNNGMCTAVIRYGDALFELRPLGGDAHVLIRIDEAKLPSEHPPEFPTGAQVDRENR